MALYLFIATHIPRHTCPFIFKITFNSCPHQWKIKRHERWVSDSPYAYLYIYIHRKGNVAQCTQKGMMALYPPPNALDLLLPASSIHDLRIHRESLSLALSLSLSLSLSRSRSLSVSVSGCLSICLSQCVSLSVSNSLFCRIIRGNLVWSSRRRRMIACIHMHARAPTYPHTQT